MSAPAPIAMPSPNHDSRGDAPVAMLVLHYTGMQTGVEALARLCDPAAKVSAHYTIDEDGSVYAHVPEDRRAWHAGVAGWRGHRDINARSIGIELVNPGHEFGYRDFPEVQIAALIGLIDGIRSRHAIADADITGHSDVAPARKQDPGERFPWTRLAAAGHGLMPAPDTAPVAEACVEAALARIGYMAELADLTHRIMAFQRRFRPARIDGIADRGTRAALGGLVARLDAGAL